MMGKGVYRENFQPQSCSGKKAPKTGQGNGNFENIVIIDGDSDQVDDVVIIDVEEFMHQKLHGSSVPSRDRTYTHQSVISVDDDESDDDDEIIAEGVGELDSDASSSKRFSAAPSRMQSSASNTQQSREACSAKATGLNRYGLDLSEVESSESDCSDCEVLEVCEQWEKASFKRKRHVYNDQSCYDEHPSSSGFQSCIYVDIEMENMTEEHAGSPVYSGPSNSKYVKGNQSSFSSKGDCHVDGIHFDSGTENLSMDSDKKVEQEGYKNGSFCDGVPGTSRFEKELCGEGPNCMSSSQEARQFEVDNKVSALRSEDDNFSEAKSNCATFDEKPVSCDELVPHAQDGGCNASNGTDIINEREKFKETDEYKRANEEEWASRQRQLQIQAEEAQRLRKRKKAETKRLLDMQRRQKERVEEVRETQKKDEEFLNMKEQLRAEIRQGLNKLEMQCRDMTSLLRGLGIHVGGGFIPLPNEVQAAYKRALFKFHPDRASKTDVREQVEAEEKFKLISRMKEKFL